MNNKAVCEKCVYFRREKTRPFCKAFGGYLREEQAKRETPCAAFLAKRQDGKKIKQVVFDEMEGEK